MGRRGSRLQGGSFGREGLRIEETRMSCRAAIDAMNIAEKQCR